MVTRKRADAADPVADTALVADPGPDKEAVVLEDGGEARPDDGYTATDYRIRVGGVFYDHVGEAPDGRWIYRRH